MLKNKVLLFGLIHAFLFACINSIGKIVNRQRFFPHKKISIDDLSAKSDSTDKIFTFQKHEKNQNARKVIKNILKEKNSSISLKNFEIPFKPLKLPNIKKGKIRQLMKLAIKNLENPKSDFEDELKKEEKTSNSRIKTSERRASLLSTEGVHSKNKQNKNYPRSVMSTKEIDPDVLNLLLKHRRMDFKKMAKKDEEKKTEEENDDQNTIYNLNLELELPNEDLLMGNRHSIDFFCNYNVKKFDSAKEYENAMKLIGEFNICYDTAFEAYEKSKRFEFNGQADCVRKLYQLTYIMANFDKLAKYLIYGQVITDNNAAKWISMNRLFNYNGKIENDKFYISLQAFLQTFKSKENSFDLINFKDTHFSEAVFIGNLFKNSKNTEINMDAIVYFSVMLNRPYIASFFYQLQSYSIFFSKLTSFLNKGDNETSDSQALQGSPVYNNQMFDLTLRNYLGNYFLTIFKSLSEFMEEMDDQELIRYLKWSNSQRNKGTKKAGSSPKGYTFNIFDSDLQKNNHALDKNKKYIHIEDIEIKEIILGLQTDELEVFELKPRELKNQEKRTAVIEN